MSDETNSTRLVVLVPEQLSAEVDELAKKEGLTRSHIGRRALRQYMERECKAASK